MADWQLNRMGEPRAWAELRRRFREYENRWGVTAHPMFRGREGWFVAARAVLLTVLAVLIWRVEASSWCAVGYAAVALLLLLDCFIVVTNHAFFEEAPPKQVFRFVLLNLVTFFSLMPWFTIVLRFFQHSFCPTLTLDWAFTLAFTLLTTASALPDVRPVTRAASWLVMMCTVTSLYFVLVVLAAAMSRVRYGDRDTRRTPPFE